MFHKKGRRLHVLLNGALKRNGIIKYLNVKTRLLFSSPSLIKNSTRLIYHIVYMSSVKPEYLSLKCC